MAQITVTPSEETWIVRADGAILAETRRAKELREGGHPPVVFIPREDVAMEFFEPSPTATASTVGQRRHFSFVGRDGKLADAAWTYEAPREEAAEIAGHLAFHPAKVRIERA